MRLEADWRPASQPGRGVVVLFHVIPPSNDRSGYFPRVREDLAAESVGGLNADRRGAGGSEGHAQDAFTGGGGRRDVEAAVRFVLDPERGCAVDDLPLPAAVIFMSPGAYTEDQFPLEPNQADRGWSFVERGTSHGKSMFNGANLEGLTVEDIRAWIGAVQSSSERPREAEVAHPAPGARGAPLTQRERSSAGGTACSWSKRPSSVGGVPSSSKTSRTQSQTPPAVPCTP